MYIWIYLIYATLFDQINGRTLTPKIYNGIEAGADTLEHPWVVWIEYEGVLICHGSLVARNWVLLPASCVNDIATDDIRKIRPILGDRNRALEDGEQTNRATQVILHPDFTANDPENDVALIKLKRRANVRRDWLAVVPKLAKQNNEDNVLDGNIRCRIAGWGNDIENGQETEVDDLQYRFVQFEDSSSCNAISGFNTNTHLCYTGFPCTGDEGVPIICYINQNWIQVGMHLYGRTQDGCTSGQKVSLSIAAFRQWIRSTIENN